MGEDDPLWYDRAEVDVPPGMLLNAAAFLFLLLAAGFVAALQVYWLPDRLWCSTINAVKRYRTMWTNRFGSEQHLYVRGQWRPMLVNILPYGVGKPRLDGLMPVIFFGE